MKERSPPALGEPPGEEIPNPPGCGSSSKSGSSSHLSTSLSLHEIQNVESPSKTGTPDALEYPFQVSKDQVYNVPSQENASLLQSNLKSRTHDHDPYCSFANVVGVFLVIIILVLIMVISIYYCFLLPNKPTFFIDRLIVYYMNDTRGKYFPQYDFTLETRKRNAAVGVIYDRGEDAFLSFQQLKIATKDPPLLDEDIEELESFRVVLPGSDSVVPFDLLERLNVRDTIPLSLSIDLHVKMKFGVVNSWGTDMNIWCNFRVNSLAKDIQILSQKCHVTV